MSGRDDAEDSRRRQQAPYTPRHTIPTIQKYREEKGERQQLAAVGNDKDDSDETSKVQRARDAWNEHTQDQKQAPQDGEQEEEEEEEEGDDGKGEGSDSTGDFDDEEPAPDTSEVDPTASDPKQRRKKMGKKRKDERAERQVTDPVTHLPVTIHDYTSEALQEIDENMPPFGSTPRTSTGLSNKNKSNQHLQKENHDNEKGVEATQALFPPPEYKKASLDIMRLNRTGMTVGLGGSALIIVLALCAERLLVRSDTLREMSTTRWSLGLLVQLILGVFTIGGITALILGVRSWTDKQMARYLDESIWENNFKARERQAKAHDNETVTWLNMLVASVWPLVNPDLLTSLADTLEDVMQASLPKLVQMVSVEDLGQGSESLRILGVRWLPTGAAARSVGQEGKLKSKDDSNHSNDRSVPGEGEVDQSAGDDDDKKNAEQKEGDGGDGSEKQEISEGFEAEEGDFVNLEVAFAYRARSEKVTMKDRMKDMHLYLAFYLPGGVKLPVWVDLRGIIGTVRLRLQLAPDPPFFALCTLTFLGQPRVELSCKPLLKRAPNIMDVPLISNFVQASVDAAMAEYVAPKSLTLDLKDMLAGDDFKKDTGARGVIVVHIDRGFDFKTGDPGIPLIKDGGADPYVSVGWAKFGKTLWSTRILKSEMQPCWRETTYILVTSQEINVDERLRVMLWDSDRFTADDDLGRIEIDVKQIMKSEESNGKMHQRTDGFRALKAGEDMPGKLDWSVGYFSKARLQACQLDRQTYDPDVRSMEQLRKKVDQICETKLREASIKKGRHSKDADELSQQKAQEMKSRQDAMIISAPPPDGLPSGIFSIQIHQITGLELEKLNKNQADKDSEGYEEEESGDSLPSSYCTVIMNHNKIFKTRTKPKNAKPFFNAGVERFIPDWQNAEVYVSVRDARVKEDDPLLGIVHLPLSEVFRERSQVSRFYPLMGGVGFGRIRISMVWRSVQLQAPARDLGWAYGTVEAVSGVTTDDLPQELQQMKIKFHTNLGSGKMYPSKDEGGWTTSKHKSLKLAVQQRYASCLAIQFRHHGVIHTKTDAFAILWLRDIPDEQEQDLTLPVWKGDFKRAIACCVDDCGEKIGSIKLKMTFWSGLGHAHSRWATKDPNMQDIVQVLECAADNYETHQTAKQAGIVDEEGDTDNDDDDNQDSSDDDDPDNDDRPSTSGGPQAVGGAEGDQDQHDENDDAEKKVSKRDALKRNKQNVFQSAKDYKHHMKSSHRRHRGVMQWRIPRTAQWMYHKAERAEEKVAGVFKHHTRQPGVETEV